MPTFFSVSLLTIMVVAGIAAVGWVRGRSQQAEDASNKKKDKEIVAENRIEIVVAEEKESLTGTETRSDRDHAGTQTSPTISSIRSSLTNKIALELVNRRQYVKAVCDRFESWSSGDQQPDSDEMVAVKPIAVNGQEVVPSGNATSAFRTKPKPNNLSSFVRQCVSNIERSAVAAGALSARTISPRNSVASNQCESPPKSSMMDERRLPSLVTATDCDPARVHVCEDVDDERALQEETVTKRVLRRVPSDNATPIAFARPFTVNTAPTLAPFAAIAMKTLPSNSLPPVWSRVSKPETSSQVVAKSDGFDPEKAESPVEHEPVGSSGEEEEEEADFQTPVMPPPPRKVSNNASRLLQFQQLVPSNQARTSFVAN